ncbi:MAG TPA: glycoside hydrolase family 3 N-terminal domain-containing protein [Rectinemataceae bacterium]|nr:glycoside hydrolase family 3 N-terminal domain-containing protein [Rectinemataceae bacterium]
MKSGTHPSQQGFAAGMILGGLPLSGLDASQARARAAELVAAYLGLGVRAFVFPGVLLEEPELLAELVRLVRRSAEAGGSGSPLLALGDELQPGFGQAQLEGLPNPLGIAALESPAAAKRAGSLLGARLAAAGIDLLLAPRLDLASDPKGRAGVLDCFGEDPQPVARLGAAFARALARHGVAACAGRFPGLGTLCGSCSELPPLMSQPADRLVAHELRPFSRLIRRGVAAVLVGRALVPSFEPEKIPAARSARIIEGRLREELHFRGLVIGDDLAGEREPGRAAVLGALAGCDLSLASTPEIVELAAAALKAAAAEGELPTPRLVVAGRRLDYLVRLSERRGAHPASPNRALAEACARDLEASLTRLRGGAAQDYDSGSTLVALFVPPGGTASETESAAAAIRAELPAAHLETLHADPAASEVDAVSALLSEKGRYRSAAIFTCDAHLRPTQEGLARSIEEAVERSAVVAMRDPYDAAFFPRASLLLAAYGFSAAACGAAARFLAGRAEAGGRCPVQVIGLEV